MSFFSEAKRYESKIQRKQILLCKVLWFLSWSSFLTIIKPVCNIAQDNILYKVSGRLLIYHQFIEFLSSLLVYTVFIWTGKQQNRKKMLSHFTEKMVLDWL